MAVAHRHDEGPWECTPYCRCTFATWQERDAHLDAMASQRKERKMALKRTIYADKDELINRLAVEQGQAKDVLATRGLPLYRRQYHQGKIDALAFAIAMLRDWRGEQEPPDLPWDASQGAGY